MILLSVLGAAVVSGLFILGLEWLSANISIRNTKGK